MTQFKKVPDGLIELIHDPNFGPVHSVSFASGSGTNFDAVAKSSKDPDAKYSIDLLITDKEFKKGTKEYIGAIEFAKKHGIDNIARKGYQFCGSYLKAKEDPVLLVEYQRKSLLFNKELYHEIVKWEQENKTSLDLALLCGYMRFFQGDLLRRFNKKALNIHPADLDVLDKDGMRAFVGDYAVKLALKAGKTKTRSSLIIIDDGEDSGPILASGPWTEYTGSKQITDKDCDKHQGIQKEVSDWPTFIWTMKAISRGELGFHKKKFHHDGNPVVVYQNYEMHYKGVDLVEMKLL